MNTYSGEWWEIDLLDGWEAEPEDPCVTVYRSDGVGALQMSAYQKESGEGISRDSLLKATQLGVEQYSSLVEQDWGQFHGFQFESSSAGRYLRQWWLTDGRTLLFATYNCSLADRTVESKSVDAMMKNLRSCSEVDSDASGLSDNGPVTMRIEEFAQMTQRAIGGDGLEGFLPSLCLPTRRVIMALEGIGEDKQDHTRRIALEWAEAKAEKDEEFLLAIREDSEHFRVIRRCDGLYEERVFKAEKV